jgi:hypothetical protein
LANAVVTSENSWCDVTQSEGGAAMGPNWTTAPRLAKKSMTSHESLISHCARICYKKKKKFRLWKKKNTQRMCPWWIHHIELNKIFQSTFRFVKPKTENYVNQCFWIHDAWSRKKL